MTGTFIVLLATLASPADDVAFNVTIISPAVHPGQPLMAEIAANRRSEKQSVKGVSFYHDALVLSLLDANNKPIYTDVAAPHRCGGKIAHRWGAMFDESTDISHRVIINEWFSTDLPPGKYSLRMELTEAMFLTQADVSVDAQGVIGQRWRPHDVDQKWDLPFEILENDEVAVQNTYQDLLNAIRAEHESRSAKHAEALETLTYAREPAALPFQLELYLQDESLIEVNTGFDPNPYYYDLPMRFIESNSPKAASALVAYYESMLGKEPEGPYVPMRVRYNIMRNTILWAIYQLHDQGNPDVVKITQPIVDATDRPRDPRPIN